MNSMEEDIKILEDLAKILDRTCENNNCEQSRAIENLIKAYKELEEENQQIEAIKDEAIRRYNFESIPVSLVEEKIEEVNKEDENLMYKNNIIKVLQELLEKRK